MIGIILILTLWVIGIIISMYILITSYIERDKEGFETGIGLLAVSIFMGFLFGPLIIIAVQFD